MAPLDYKVLLQVQISMPIVAANRQNRKQSRWACKLAWNQSKLGSDAFRSRSNAPLRLLQITKTWPSRDAELARVENEVARTVTVIFNSFCVAVSMPDSKETENISNCSPTGTHASWFSTRCEAGHCDWRCCCRQY